MILIGDNPQLARDFYRKITLSFTKVYFETTAASLFKQAIALKPRFIILNFELLGESIYRLCRNLKDQDILANTPLILTNLPNEIDAKSRGLKAGADDVVTQPFDHVELLQRVKQQLRYQELQRLQQQQDESLHKTIKRQRVLSAVIERIRHSLDLDKIFWRTVEELHFSLKCDRAVIYRFNPDWSGDFVAEALSPQWRSVINNPSEAVEKIKANSASEADSDQCIIKLLDGKQNNKIKDTYLQENQGGIYQNKDATYRAVNDINSAGFSRCYIELLETFQAKAYVVVPIFLGDHLWGLLGIYQNDAPRQWQPQERDMLLQIASQLGIALQQAEMLRELRVAKEKAEAANKAKSLFLANISHELRTPLSSILGFAELLGNDPSLEPDQLDSVNCIYQSGKHLLDLINDVLSMSQIEAGKVTLNPETFELMHCLMSIKNILQIAANRKEINLVFQLDENLPEFVYFDQAKLRQILINLLSNAIKFTDIGEVALQVTCRVISESMSMLRFEVIDTGLGIPAAEQKVLFQAFQQTTSGRQSKQGTGLGLAISQSFVQKMGGEIKVESEVGHGSRFWFELPINHRDIFAAPKDELLDISPFGIVPTDTDGQNMPKVLIVEEHLAQRELLQVQLMGLDLQTEVTADSRAGLQCWRSWQPDLVLLNLRMPSVDGQSMIQEINQAIAANPEYKKPKIIVLTADVFYDQDLGEPSVACDDIIYKPVPSDRLLNTIQSHIKTGKGESNK
ncbi:ATP-binding protein [[Limnothrix rosea] IAM M-220]|uniref:ATP-binding protein n=1 Tax=[Limnothrix rosea] IAM M-220 TaxID=454133 RepID=UPI0009614550|nr:ATP-binding protein [[Limnothrix rosea] IAM M-220]OKH11627.1 hypothetical protein NIES208_16995 [[Limnothrix rosea] IAM M-220]